MARSKITKYKGHTIRSRRAGWQVDFGVCDEKRVQRSYKTKDGAKLAIDAHVDERGLKDIRMRIGKLAGDYGETPVHEITMRGLDRRTDKQGIPPGVSRQLPSPLRSVLQLRPEAWLREIEQYRGLGLT